MSACNNQTKSGVIDVEPADWRALFLLPKSTVKLVIPADVLSYIRLLDVYVILPYQDRQGLFPSLPRRHAYFESGWLYANPVQSFIFRDSNSLEILAQMSGMMAIQTPTVSVAQAI